MRVVPVHVVCAAIVASACKENRATPPEPSASASPSASTAPSAARGLERDPDGHLRPRKARPHDDPALVPAAPTHEPGWDLDPSAPERDYVERYVRATMRYAERSPCTEARVAGDRDGRTVVEVRDARPAPRGCPAPTDELRDTFLVDVSADRLGLGAPNPSRKLASWPDGSAPDAPPNAGPSDQGLPDAYPLLGALRAMRLVPVRLEMYGRGSYPVITLAGWRTPIAADASPESLRTVVEKVCAATHGMPVGFFAGIDRSRILRARCPDGARWESL